MKIKTIVCKVCLILLSIGADLAVVAFLFKTDWREETFFSIVISLLLVAGVRHTDFVIYVLFRRISRTENDI